MEIRMIEKQSGKANKWVIIVAISMIFMGLSMIFTTRARVEFGLLVIIVTGLMAGGKLRKKVLSK